MMRLEIPDNFPDLPNGFTTFSIRLFCDFVPVVSPNKGHAHIYSHLQTVRYGGVILEGATRMDKKDTIRVRGKHWGDLGYKSKLRGTHPPCPYSGWT